MSGLGRSNVLVVALLLGMPGALPVGPVPRRPARYVVRAWRHEGELCAEVTEGDQRCQLRTSAGGEVLVVYAKGWTAGELPMVERLALMEEAREMITAEEAAELERARSAGGER